jgi:hypothetical protein
VCIYLTEEAGEEAVDRERLLPLEVERVALEAEQCSCNLLPLISTPL